MSDSIIIMYGTDWCWDCTRARRFLKRNDIPFEWINIDKDHEAEKFVLETNKGMRSVPTIVFPDGSIMVEPSTKNLKEKVETLN